MSPYQKGGGVLPELIQRVHIDTLRGLACVLVVAFHAIGAEPTSGMHVADNSGYRGFCNLFMHVRMPLFAFLSGVVYAFWPVQPGRLEVFVQKKIRRLVIPFVTITSIYYLMTLIAPYEKSAPPLDAFWKIYLFPFAQYWFLQAMILIFALVAVLDHFRILAHERRFWLVYGLAVLACINIQITPDVFSADHALELLPCFLLGLAVVRYQGWLIDRRVGIFCACAAFGMMAWYAYVVFDLGGPIIPKRSVTGFAMGTFGIVALLHWFPSWRPLAVIGQYSFAIYLFHAFFTGGARLIMLLLHVPRSSLALFAACLLAGLAGPVAVELLTRRIPWLARAMLGQSPNSGGAANAAA